STQTTRTTRDQHRTRTIQRRHRREAVGLTSGLCLVLASGLWLVLTGLVVRQTPQPGHQHRAPTHRDLGLTRDHRRH
ncbi:hypothetical protein NGM36_00865, partial [Streptomyces mutabilis]|uniref:hypothetical protein n=1 Tax=Streptomyces mutabilis TaxID=67332 RepID=UPI0022BA5E84